MERLKLRYNDCRNALKTLKIILDEKYSIIVRDATIQRFEYTFEAFWKFVKEFLREREGIVCFVHTMLRLFGERETVKVVSDQWGSPTYTGETGFIGSNFIKYILTRTNFNGKIVNDDSLTYAGNPENLVDIEKEYGGKRYFFEKIDICNYQELKEAIERFEIDTIVHFAAESHVDRSIFGPRDFINTNIIGTFNLLEIIREFWEGEKDVLHLQTAFFHQTTEKVIFFICSNRIY